MNIGKEYINRFGKGIGASLLAMIMVLSIAVVLSTPASALPVPPGTNGIYWLEPASSSAPYGDSVTLDVWVNSSIPLFGGTFTIETDPDTCGEFVVGTFDDNTTYFDMGHAIIDEEKHRLFIGYQTVGFVERPPGPYHLGSFEIKCNSTSACTTDVEYIPDLPNTYITNTSGNYDTVEQDATFECEGPPVITDWMQFHYDIANTGNSPSNAPDDNTTKWISDNIGAAASSQAMIVGDKVFVYANDTVYALNKASGAVLWQTSIPGDTQGWGSWASPAYDDDMLFVSAGYNLTKLNATTGAKLQEIAFPDGGYSCNGGPTVADGMVFAGSGGGNYYAFDENDLNTVLWTYATPSGGSAVSTPAVADGKVVVGEMTWGGASVLSCIDEATGSLLWSTSLVGDVGGSAAIDAINNRVYVATFVDYIGDTGKLYALAFDTGAIQWSADITYSDSTPAISGDYIYVSGSVNAPGVTYCFNQAGALQWDVPCGSWTMSPAVADGKLFTGKVGTNWGAVDGICVFDALTGAPVWSDDDDAGSSPSVAESVGMAVSIGNDGKVYAFGTPESVDIYVEPELTNIAPQDQFDVNIVIDPHGIPIYGVEYYLTYDTSIVRAESQVKGPFLGPASDTIVVVNEIDRTNGIVSYAETRKVQGGVTDPGVSSVIQFTAIGPADTCTDLNLSGVIIVDTGKEPVLYEITNGKACIILNNPPEAAGCSKHRINNAQKKFECLAQLCSNSTDDDGDDIVYIRWAFGDGEYGTSEGLGECPCKFHSYISWNWVPFGDPNGDYEPFIVNLTVTDNGDPQLEDTTSFPVTVYMAGDANGDGMVNIIDAVYVGLNWGDTCSGTGCCEYLWATDEDADAADLNNDCQVNILDAVIVGTMWGHEAWY
ncbi:MAG: cell surface protein [Candidatus Syntrophoarchaeum caldarius]|uniref:Cell surface protein n=1 Tax=Candidatus Syntropharchaeum caldarium TaxID=1838285 RepID=A0A1F2PB19_9EURY|nr:MAG: cell surface protein [Candidatus Syntrophoarchaeum caldarius]